MDFHGGGPEVDSVPSLKGAWVWPLVESHAAWCGKKKKKVIHSGSQVLVKPEKEYSNSLLICNLDVYNHKGWH